MKNIRVKVNAKINLSLNILGMMENGYHALESVMTSVDIFDNLSLVKRTDQNIYLSSRDMAVGAHNSAVRAANAFLRAFGTTGVDIRLRKSIPFSAGLGGSSADAAAVLAGMAALYGITDKKTIRALASELGSDVPYMTEGGFKLVGGMGENIQSVAADRTLFFVIAKPEKGVSTAECYRLFDSMGGGSPTDNQALIQGLQEGNLEKIAKNTGNMLEDAAIKLMPEIGEVKALMQKEKPLAVFMTGSGSAVVGLCESKEQAGFIANRLQDRVALAVSAASTKRGIVPD